MRKQMISRIGPPKQDLQFPIWAWYQATNAPRKRPDLRESGYFPPGTTGYRIEIEKASKEVLLSDFELWHSPLSHRYFIGASQTEAEEFNAHLREVYGTHAFEQLPPDIQQKIERSWEKIFDLGFDVAYFARPLQEKQIQATFWELNMYEVVEVDQFRAR